MHMQLETAQQSNEADKDNTAVFQKNLQHCLKLCAKLRVLQYNTIYITISKNYSKLSKYSYTHPGRKLLLFLSRSVGLHDAQLSLSGV